MRPKNRHWTAACGIAAAWLYASGAHSATIVVANVDPLGVGFNDTTPATTPAPGNTGTTIGEQKMKVVQWAAAKLGSLLYSPVPIVIEVAHDDTLYCEANAATLAAAGPAWLMRSAQPLVADHPDVATWYPSALYHRLTGSQLFSEDVTAVFNPDLGASDCMDGFTWYYGFDNTPPPGALPFVDTVLHELTHGLGFTSMAGDDGLISPLDPDAISPYFAFALDTASGKRWWNMTAEERVTSATSGLLVWAGPATTAAADGLVTAPLDEHGHLYMYAPGTYEQGSSLSHFEESTSPDLLMEPFASSQLNVIDNDIDLAREFLHDIGWRDADCGNGVVDPPEECDHGEDNDANADAEGECNTSCQWFVVDDCPSDPAKTEPGVCGCGVADSDSDGDGTEDCNDDCPDDGAKTEPGACGCGTADTDSDGDQTPNCFDECAFDPNKVRPGTCGCGTGDEDSDDDGTADCLDACPEDSNKTQEGVCGCGTSDEDSDEDGAADCIDQCPNDANKTTTGMCGCGIADVDSDGDTALDCLEACPNDPAKVQPLVCGCGVADLDSDGDGILDCNDECPADGSKVTPGMCGCGTSDRDRDADGTPDCDDRCGDDALKTSPGACGCGTPDTDSDGDGEPDCSDDCSNDPNKTSPGACGCGASDRDSDGDGVPDCDDGCPMDGMKLNPGECGCGSQDADRDNDGTVDCFDACPTDDNKSAPGACGCGTSDIDQDLDGTPDCDDGCPDDGDKLEPGDCGCGSSDVDRDGDGLVDCVDECPTQPGLPEDDGCMPDVEDFEPPSSGDAGAPPGDAGVELADLFNDGGIDRDKLEELLGDAGTDPDELGGRLLQQALDDFTADGGARVDLDLALPDACQCRVLGSSTDSSPRAWVWLVGLLGLVWARRRGQRSPAS